MIVTNKKLSLIILATLCIGIAQPSNAFAMHLLLEKTATWTNSPRVKAVIVGGLIATIAHKAINSHQWHTIHWPWQNIDPTSINSISITQFFKNRVEQLKAQGIDWLWGAGSSAYQVEGNCTNTNWYDWIEQHKQKNPQTTLEHDGNAIEFLTRYKEDIKLLKQLGINTFRMSVEWSKVMPTENSIDTVYLTIIEDICKELVANGIKPVITLFHYTEPTWFYKKTRMVPTKQLPDHLKGLTKKWFWQKDDTELALTGWEDEQNIRFHYLLQSSI